MNCKSLFFTACMCAFWALWGLGTAYSAEVRSVATSSPGKWMGFPQPTRWDLRYTWGSVYWNADVNDLEGTQDFGTIGHFITSSGAWEGRGAALGGSLYGVLHYRRGLDWWGTKLDDNASWLTGGSEVSGKAPKTNCISPADSPCDTADARFYFVGDGKLRYVSDWARESAAQLTEFGTYEVELDNAGQPTLPKNYRSLIHKSGALTSVGGEPCPVITGLSGPLTTCVRLDAGKLYGFYVYTKPSDSDTDFRVMHTDSDWNRMIPDGNKAPTGQTFNDLNFADINLNLGHRMTGYQHFAIFREPAADKDWYHQRQNFVSDNNDTLWVGVKVTDASNLYQADFNDLILRIGRTPPHPIGGASGHSVRLADSNSPGPKDINIGPFKVMPPTIGLLSFDTTVRLQNDYAPDSKGDIKSVRLRLRDCTTGACTGIPLGGKIQILRTTATLNGEELREGVDYFWNNHSYWNLVRGGYDEALDIVLAAGVMAKPEDVLTFFTYIHDLEADATKRSTHRFDVLADINFEPIVTLRSAPLGAGYFRLNGEYKGANAEFVVGAGDSNKIEAVANFGYVWRYFSGGLTGSSNPQDLNTMSSQSIVANFARAIPVLSGRVVEKTGDQTNRMWKIEIKNSGPVDATNARVGVTFAPGVGTLCTPVWTATTGSLPVANVAKDGGAVVVPGIVDFAKAGCKQDSRFTVTISTWASIGDVRKA